MAGVLMPLSSSRSKYSEDKAGSGYQNGGPAEGSVASQPSVPLTVDEAQSELKGCSHCCCRGGCHPWVARMLYRCRRSNLRTGGLMLFIFVYLIIGGVIFSVLESPIEREMHRQMDENWNKFLGENSCVRDTELEDFVVQVIEANNRGVSAARNVSNEPNWSFGQSLFFAGTVLTTIGYGHVTPLSEGGKIFCIVYASIGIPLTLIMFTALVERLMVLTSRMLQGLQDGLGHLYRTIHIRLIHLSIILLVLIVFVFIIPSTIFFFLEEKWNFLDAFYYCFISMTTIGLGDYIPGDDPLQKHRPLYKICTTFYLFAGLVLMMLTLANIYDVPELNIGYHFYMRSDEDDEERKSLRAHEAAVPKYTTQQDNKAYQDDTRSDEQRILNSD